MIDLYALIYQKIHKSIYISNFLVDLIFGIIKLLVIFHLLSSLFIFILHYLGCI